jgi:hypothetical protein
MKAAPSTNMPSEQISIKSIILPYYFKLYYQIFSYYDSVSINNKCVYIWDTITNRYIDMSFKIGDDVTKVDFNKLFWYQDNKLENELFRTYKKWIRKVKKYGLAYMIDNKISPLKDSRFIWKKR